MWTSPRAEKGGENTGCDAACSIAGDMELENHSDMRSGDGCRRSEAGERCVSAASTEGRPCSRIDGWVLEAEGKVVFGSMVTC